MLLVYTPKITPRIHYTFRLFFKYIWGIDGCVTDNKEDFCKANCFKLSYADAPINCEPFIQPSGLLTEKGIKSCTPTIGTWEGVPTLFPTDNPTSWLPFDIFSAAFYLVSRYEEYKENTQKDEHQRFTPEQSIAYQNNFLHQPIVNIWAMALKKKLIAQYPYLDIKNKPKYRFYATIDIDHAFAYSGKGIIRGSVGIMNCLLKGNWKEFKQRVNVLLLKHQDPFDTYEYQHTTFQKYKVRAMYFALLGNYGRFDTNLPHTSLRLQSLLKQLADHYKIGIHPSYASNQDKTLLNTEIQRLNSILHREIKASRQHFIKLQLPSTYRNLLSLDITEDYSMGYPNQYGFRAGICTYFNFYDLELEVETPLRIHPFAFMEGTFQNYMQASPADSIQKIKELIDEVKAVNGTFSMIWHNHTLSNKGCWKGWREVFEQTIVYGKEVE